MSTDCAVIVKVDNLYAVFPYIKWDGYPEGKGQSLQRILNRNNDKARVIFEINAIAEEFCRISYTNSFEEALDLLHVYIDYIYYINLETHILYLYNYRTLIPIKDYILIKQFLNSNQHKKQSKKDFAQYFCTKFNPSLIDFALEMAKDYGYEFLQVELMETE